MNHRQSPPKPNWSKSVDVKAWLFEEMGACGCSNLVSMLEYIREALRWTRDSERPPFYNERTPWGGNEGVFYITMGRLEESLLIEHGIGIRFPWLTDAGRHLLAKLEHCDLQTIEDAEGTAYNGQEYFR
jgi:hypothetical protein